MKKKLFAITVAAGQMILAAPALAQTPIGQTPEIPSSSVQDIQGLAQLLAKLAGYLMFIAGAIAVVFLIIGGIYYITSTGDTTKAEKAKKIIINSLVGIVIIALALSAVNIISNFFK